MTFEKNYFMLPFVADATEVMEAWQSWFNAPDLKSDVGASLPGVRIPALPPVKGAVLEIKQLFFLFKWVNFVC